MTRAIAYLVLVLMTASALLTALLAPSPSAQALPGFTPTEYLALSGTVQNDANKSDVHATTHQLVDGDPGLSNTLFWETNDTYLYWGNATSSSDTGSHWGIGRAIFRLSDPVGTAPYWRLSATYWAAPITFLSPTWTQIGTYGQSSTGTWSSANLGFGYTTTPTSSVLDHYQMHTSAYVDSFWEVSVSSNTGEPPASWTRPQTGTDWWDSTTNTLTGQPWTLDQVRNLCVIFDFRFEYALFSYINKVSGSGAALALGGLSVAIAPYSYTPPTYANGFVLRPESDVYVTSWEDPNGNQDLMYSEVDETLANSDQDTTRITTTRMAVGATVLWELTDPPDGAIDGQYVLYPWIITKAVTQSYNDVFGWGLTPGTGTSSFMLENAVPTAYRNYSFESLANPNTGARWSLEDLDSVRGWVAIMQTVDSFPFPNSGNQTVTQFAVLCVPLGGTSPTGDDLDDADTDFSGDAFLAWFKSGGIAALFGIIGFLGLIASPVIAAYAYREGMMDGMEVLVMVFLFLILFFGLFWVGVQTHWT